MHTQNNTTQHNTTHNTLLHTHTHTHTHRVARVLIKRLHPLTLLLRDTPTTAVLRPC